MTVWDNPLLVSQWGDLLSACFAFACLCSLIPNQEFSQHHNIISNKLYYMHTAFVLFVKPMNSPRVVVFCNGTNLCFWHTVCSCCLGHLMDFCVCLNEDLFLNSTDGTALMLAHSPTLRTGQCWPDMRETQPWEWQSTFCNCVYKLINQLCLQKGFLLIYLLWVYGGQKNYISVNTWINNNTNMSINE